MNSRALRIVSGLLLGLAILVYLGYFLVYLRYAAALIQFPFDYDQGEGFELNDSVLFAHGEWPYKSNEAYPFYASNYPPLYHLLLVPLVWIFGPAYWYGRLFSFLSTLVTAGFIAYAVHRATRDRPISAISGLAYLASNYVYHVGPLFRQHISMVMFETLAVVILAPLGAPDDSRRENWRLFWGMLCLLAAGYTKQLAYATVAICLLFIVSRGIKRGLIAAAVFVTVAAVLFGAINVATGGQWWVNIILANINEFVPGQMEGLYRQWYDLHLILIWLSILFVIAVAAGFVLPVGRRRITPTGNRSNVLYTLWFIGSVANGSLAGKWGAGESYFMTSIAAACICAGILSGEWRRLAAGWRPALQWASAVLIPLLFIAQGSRLLHLPTQGRLFKTIAGVAGLPVDQRFEQRGYTVIGDVGVFIDSQGLLQYYDSQGYTQLGRPPNAMDVEQGYNILAYVKAVDGPVMTEEAAFSLLAGKEQVGNPTQLLNLAKNNMLDSSGLVAMIEQRLFDIIVLKAEFYPRPVLKAIGQNYESVETITMNGFNYRVLKPRQESSDAP